MNCLFHDIVTWVWIATFRPLTAMNNILTNNITYLVCIKPQRDNNEIRLKYEKHGFQIYCPVNDRQESKF